MVQGDEAGNPAVGALAGLIRVVAYEHPDLHATLVDLGTTDDVATALVTELASPGSDDVIALAGWASVRRTPIPGDSRCARTQTGGPRGRRVHTDRRPGRVGHGRRPLARRQGRGTHRSQRPHRTVRQEQANQLAELEGRAEIAVVLGDIASPGIAERLVAVAEETGLALRGVMHAAAVLDDGLVTALSKESLDRVWAPKAGGRPAPA